jgi:hypothetical protein
MATTYTMKLDSVQVKWQEEQLKNIITSVTYIITAISDDGIRKDMQKQIPMSPPSAIDFIPIENVTEEILTLWVQNNPEYLTEVDVNIFNIRFGMERDKEYTTSYNFPFINSPLTPYKYFN